MDYGKLELITQSTNPFAEDAIYYRLGAEFRYCGWKDMPHMLLDMRTTHLSSIQGIRKEILGMANGRINFNLEFIPNEIRAKAKEMEKDGIIEKCKYEENAGEYKEYPARRVRIVKWAITGRCNLKCKHCFLSAPDAKFGELPLEQCKRIIGEMAECGVTHVELTGGEPLSRPDFFEIVDELSRKKICLTDIATNGMLLNERVVGEFEARGMKPHVFMSFDGVGWHDWLRGMEGLEAQLMKRFELLAKHGFATGSAMTVHKLNVGVLRETINRLADVGCKMAIINKMTNFGEWQKYGQDFNITHKELFDAYVEYLPHFFEDGMPINVALNRILMLRKGKYEYEMQAYRRCTDINEAKVCPSTWSELFITADGKLAPCISIAGIDAQAKNFADIIEMGFYEALHHSKHTECTGATVAEFFEHNPDCKTCEYRMSCLGGCRAQALEFNDRDYLTPDIMRCDFFKENYTEKIIKRLADTVPEAKCINLSE